MTGAGPMARSCRSGTVAAMKNTVKALFGVVAVAAATSCSTGSTPSSSASPGTAPPVQVTAPPVSPDDTVPSDTGEVPVPVPGSTPIPTLPPNLDPHPCPALAPSTFDDVISMSLADLGRFGPEFAAASTVADTEAFRDGAEAGRDTAFFPYVVVPYGADAPERPEDLILPVFSGILSLTEEGAVTTPSGIPYSVIGGPADALFGTARVLCPDIVLADAYVHLVEDAPTPSGPRTVTVDTVPRMVAEGPSCFDRVDDDTSVVALADVLARFGLFADTAPRVPAGQPATAFVVSADGQVILRWVDDTVTFNDLFETELVDVDGEQIDIVGSPADPSFTVDGAPIACGSIQTASGMAYIAGDIPADAAVEADQ